MANLFGRSWTRSELLGYVGDLSQIAGIKLGEWVDGVERGVRVADVRTGSGLSFTVLLDRGMDIGPAAFQGMPLAWVSPTGWAHPMYYEPQGNGWLRTFGGGLMVGCGLTYLGAAGEDEGESLGLHGRLSLLPAERVRVDQAWQADECSFWIEGELRQARVFGENLRLKRRITVDLGGNRIAVHDRVDNLGAAATPLMVLYHINLGFPFLDENAELVAEPHPVEPRDAAAEPGLNEWMRFQKPTSGYAEQVFYHDLPADKTGWAGIQLVNRPRKLGLSVRCDKAALPNLVQWKMMGQGTYVLGIEPANCRAGGRSQERARGTLQFLQPGEQREFQLEIKVNQGEEVQR
ncbi:MAG: aldose 1-epimerase family protein [Chloroflexi bacterium]|nr:aldose 1-epimerase family protein [Chloroflexota bacterium]